MTIVMRALVLLALVSVGALAFAANDLDGYSKITRVILSCSHDGEVIPEGMRGSLTMQWEIRVEGEAGANLQVCGDLVRGGGWRENDLRWQVGPPTKTDWTSDHYFFTTNAEGVATNQTHELHNNDNPPFDPQHGVVPSVPGEYQFAACIYLADANGQVTRLWSNMVTITVVGVTFKTIAGAAITDLTLSLPGTTDVLACITPASAASAVSFVSRQPGVATVSPAKATASPQRLTVTAVAQGETDVKAMVGATESAGLKVKVE